MARDLQFNKKGKPVAEEKILGFERRWELRLPLSVRRFLLEYNGGTPSKINEFYPVPERFEEFWKEYDVVPNYTPGVGIPIFYSIGDEGGGLSVEGTMKILTDSDQLAPHRVPLAGDGCGNEIMISVGPADHERLYFWDHELQREFPIADTFEEFLDGLTALPKDPKVE